MKINAKTDLKDKQDQFVTPNEADLLSIGKGHGNESAYIALKYFDEEHQCFSEWDKNELKAFTQFIRKMNQMTWIDIRKQGGSAGKKVGMGYTKHKNLKVLPRSNLIDKLSPDIDFFELRVTDEARVHGFRVKNTFFLVWLDRGHQIYPQ